MGNMKRLTIFLFILSLAALVFALGYPDECHPRSLPPYPLMETRVQPTPYEQAKAWELFRLAHKQNRRLEWDACLSRKAFKRAKDMVETGCFAHEDPQTGKNPVWETVVQCNDYQYAAENLARGNETAEATHKALMQSPAHRANVNSSKHRFLGVGCYDNICVQLFAGF